MMTRVATCPTLRLSLLRANAILLVALCLLILSITGCQIIGKGSESAYIKGGASKTPEAISSPYALGPGDKIRVTVYEHENLSGVFNIDDAGTVSLPLLRRIFVKGMTLPQLEQEITQQLVSNFRSAYTEVDTLKNPQAVVSLPSYTLSSGDKLRVTIYEHENLSGIFNIHNDGAISLPLVRRIIVKGMTLPQLEQEITQQLLNNHIAAPKVSIDLVEIHPFCVFGEVRKPSCFPYTYGMTASKAIAMTGGYTDRARKNEFVITREEGRKVSGNHDTPISAGDLLEVFEWVFSDPKVSIDLVEIHPFCVFGEVRKPSCFPYIHGMTASKAIAMAGGYTYRAKKNVLVITHEDGKEEPANHNTWVSAGDIIEVFERFF